MKLLVDTHALLWAMDDPAQLSDIARDALQNPHNELLVSAATIWELSIKVGIGKLVLSLPFGQWMETTVADLALDNDLVRSQLTDDRLRD